MKCGIRDRLMSILELLPGLRLWPPRFYRPHTPNERLRRARGAQTPVPEDKHLQHEAAIPLRKFLRRIFPPLYEQDLTRKRQGTGECRRKHIELISSWGRWLHRVMTKNAASKNHALSNNRPSPVLRTCRAVMLPSRARMGNAKCSNLGVRCATSLT